MNNGTMDLNPRKAIPKMNRSVGPKGSSEASFPVVSIFHGLNPPPFPWKMPEKFVVEAPNLKKLLS